MVFKLGALDCPGLPNVFPKINLPNRARGFHSIQVRRLNTKDSVQFDYFCLLVVLVVRKISKHTQTKFAEVSFPRVWVHLMGHGEIKDTLSLAKPMGLLS